MLCKEGKAKSAKHYMAEKSWLGEISPLFQTEPTSCGLSRTLLTYFWGKKLGIMITLAW